MGEREWKMMNTYKTEQEDFWAGEFGDAYIDRNNSMQLAEANLAFFCRILSRTIGVSSFLELGANIGMNLKALRQLIPACQLTAVEINQIAVEELKKQDQVEVHHQSILDFEVQDRQWDLTFTKGVLIHLAPEMLPEVYKTLYQCSKKYILVAEYYNPSPVEIPYRGHEGKLFKRDFAGELMEQYPDLQLVDYGFCWHKDPVFPQDDVTWFLLRK